jgi:glycosyltransferase involved in cell wall biosynthesis
VIPLGVELPKKLPEFNQIRHQLGISSQVPLILFLSRIEPKKGLDLLIPALENILEEGLDFHFVLAGSNPQDPNYENQIKTQIQASKLAKYTTITGFVKGDLKLGLLQDADIFVLPSYYENFGIAVAEAMAVGTPVVISNQVYIWQDVEEASAGWVTACNSEELSQAIKLALQDDTDRKQRGFNAEKLALEKYSWQAIANQIIEVYTRANASKFG